MFDFDIGKMIIFGVVALAVIPPKDLPRVMRTVGNYVGKMRRMAAEFQGQFMDAMKEAELDSVKKELEQLNQAAKLDTNFDPVTVMRTEMTQAVETPKSIETHEISVETPTAQSFSTAVDATPLALPAESQPIVHETPLLVHEAEPLVHETRSHVHEAHNEAVPASAQSSAS